jgi:hypothetical protein
MASQRHLTLWFLGAALALLGGAIAHWGSPAAGQQSWDLARLVGTSLGFLGLFLIALATSRRARNRAELEPLDLSRSDVSGSAQKQQQGQLAARNSSQSLSTL